MAQTVIFTEQKITGFTLNSFYGAYHKSIIPSPFELVEGQEYKILWDDVEYTRTAFAFTNAADSSSCIAVGNKMVSTGVDDGDLFAIVNDTTNSYTHLFSTETQEEHTVAIYQGAKAEVTLVLKDRQGNNIEGINDVPEIKVPTSDGGLKSFIGGTLVDKTLESDEVDFSSGSIVIQPDEGELIRKVTVQKPAELVSENIAEGISIAGIVGTFVGAGSEESRVHIWSGIVRDDVYRSKVDNRIDRPLLSVSELPDWFSVKEITDSSSKTSRPLYMIGLFSKTAVATTAYLLGVSIVVNFGVNNTGLASGTNPGGTRFSVGRSSVGNAVKAAWWAGLPSNTYNGLYILNDKIYLGEYNGYLEMKSYSDYDLIVIKIDP